MIRRETAHGFGHGPPVRPPLWPVRQALRLADVLPRGELVRVPGIGHTPTLDRFLGGVRAR